jgi:hypothetical protein
MNPNEVNPEHVGDAPSSATPPEPGGSKDAAQDPHLDTEAQDRFADLKRRATGLEDRIEAHVEAVEQEARDRAAAIIAQAEREAEEIRADTTAIVDQARERVNELMRLRQALFATLRETLGNFEGAIAQTEEERTFTEAATVQAEHAVDDTVPAPGEGEAEGEELSGETEPVEPAKRQSIPEPAEAAAIGLTVQVEVGPLGDYEAVNAVERALSDLPATRGVHLRSFDNGVAVLETFGLNVNMLLNAMRASFTIPFIVRSADAGRLALQVDEFAARGEDR